MYLFIYIPGWRIVFPKDITNLVPTKGALELQAAVFCEEIGNKEEKINK